MIYKSIHQNLDWIDNDPDSNPVVNETTEVTYRFFGIKLYSQNLSVTHSGKYSLNGVKPKSEKVSEVKGFR